MERDDKFLRDFVALTITTMTVVTANDSDTEIKEVQLIRQMAIKLGQDLQTFDRMVKEEFDSQSDLREVAERVSKENEEYRTEIMKACTAVALADGVVTSKEVEFLMALADAIGIETTQVVMMLLRLVQAEGRVKIED